MADSCPTCHIAWSDAEECPLCLAEAELEALKKDVNAEYWNKVRDENTRLKEELKSTRAGESMAMNEVSRLRKDVTGAQRELEVIRARLAVRAGEVGMAHAEVRRLKEALRPFAEHARQMRDAPHPDTMVAVRWQTFVAARVAMDVAFIADDMRKALKQPFNGESEHPCFKRGEPNGTCEGDGWFLCLACFELKPSVKEYREGD